MMNEGNCENKPAGEDNSVGEYTDEEITPRGITLWGRYALLRILTINFAGDAADKLHWGWVTVADSCGDNPLRSAGNDLLHSAEEIYFCTPLGIDFQSLLGKMIQLRWGSFFKLCWENIDSTGDILYATGEYSYTPLRNIKAVGDALILTGEYSCSPLGNIKTFWGNQAFLGLMVD
ncbi:unnamed protein product [Vicia faba]|uniref:Uncharacterized protein n=1 Tax=Vicia faba TaxID=3906 RepID=A0AAV0ZPM0_VICFA|nr:unnamed protein product [Vicia faba]